MTVLKWCCRYNTHTNLAHLHFKTLNVIIFSTTKHFPTPRTKLNPGNFPLQLLQLLSPVCSLLMTSCTHQTCRIGVAACRTASRAPPLSRNQTLYSSSKICTKKIMKNHLIKELFLNPLLKMHWKRKTFTCLQLFPASAVMNIPRLVEDSSVPIFPKWKIVNKFGHCMLTDRRPQNTPAQELSADNILLVSPISACREMSSLLEPNH